MLGHTARVLVYLNLHKMDCETQRTPKELLMESPFPQSSRLQREKI